MKIRYFTISGALTLIIFSIGLFCERSYAESMDPAARFVTNMSLEDKIGQLLIVGIPGTRISKASHTIIETYHPGGIILFGYNYQTTSQLKKLNHSLQESSVKAGSIPLFISIDQEGGRVKRITGKGVTQFPGNMCAGSANEPGLTYKWAKILGIQLRMFGVNMNLAPDIDVNNNPDNPVINTRSFGSDAALVSRHGDAFIKGQQSGGVMAVAKHFPGHGDTANDSHKILPVIPYSKERLEKVELVPFYSAVKNGVSSIMTAHILYPQIEKNGFPATLSHTFLSKILRDEMKFQGLIMTDDMEMGAIAGNMKIGEATVAAIAAGADIILVTTHRNIKYIQNALLAAVKDGTISQQRLNQSLERIIRAKFAYKIVNAADPYHFQEPKFSDLYYRAMLAADKVNRLISEKGLYFFSKDSDKIELVFSERAHIFSDTDFFRSRFQGNTRISLYKVSEIFSKLKRIKYGETIYVELRDSQASLAHRLKEHAAKHKNIVIISAENPFRITKYSGEIPVLFSFSNTRASYQALADAVVGKISVKNYSTINLGFGRD